MTAQINDVVLNFISKKSKIPKNELGPDTEIYDSKIISSLAMLELISLIESQFSIYVEPEELTEDNFQDIQTIIQFVQRKLNA
ncbi:MAG: acyl carrier protein [Proteobacteria bacterium]|nr:acyl carrier protein [Pseudomonadota bacterium]